MTLLFFSLSGLDVLDSLNFPLAKKSEIIDWIYAQQVIPDSNNTGMSRVLTRHGAKYIGTCI